MEWSAAGAGCTHMEPVAQRSDHQQSAPVGSNPRSSQTIHGRACGASAIAAGAGTRGELTGHLARVDVCWVEGILPLFTALAQCEASRPDVCAQDLKPISRVAMGRWGAVSIRARYLTARAQRRLADV